MVGGFDAWLDCAGMDWVEGQDVDNAKNLHPSPTLDPTGQNGTPHFGTTSIATSPNQTYAILTKVARGGGISRTEGKAILANIEDYVSRLIVAVLVHAVQCVYECLSNAREIFILDSS